MANNNNNNNNRNAAIGAAVGTVGAIALTPVLLPAALGIAGFGAGGIVASSLAALIQSSIGNVAAGSLFAVAQSIGAGGAIPAVAYAAAGAMGAAAGANATGGAGGAGGAGPGAGPGPGGAGPGGPGPGAGPGPGGHGSGPTGGGGGGPGPAHPGDSDNANDKDQRNFDNSNLGITSPPGYEESCYICGSEQHNGRHCPENTNGFLSQGRDGWRGPNNEEICIDFNTRSGCRNSHCTLAHICSRCGGNRHNAQNH